MDVIIERLRRALQLEPAVYREIAADDAATGQAIAVAAVAGLIGNLTGSGNFIGRVIAGAAGAVIGLLIWTGIIFLVGKIFQGQATYIQLLRGMGYSSAPFALGVIPFLGFVGFIYAIIMQIRAVREINQVSDGGAVATVLIPWAVFVLLGLLVFFAVMAAFLGFEALD